MENGGILDVFPIFHTVRLGEKIRRSPLSSLRGVALIKTALVEGDDGVIAHGAVFVQPTPSLMVISSSAMVTVSPRMAPASWSRSESTGRKMDG